MNPPTMHIKRGSRCICLSSGTRFETSVVNTLLPRNTRNPRGKIKAFISNLLNIMRPMKTKPITTPIKIETMIIAITMPKDAPWNGRPLQEDMPNEVVMEILIKTNRSDSTVMPNMVEVILPLHRISLTSAMAVAGLLAMQIEAMIVATAHLHCEGKGFIHERRDVLERRPTTTVSRAKVIIAIAVVCASKALISGFSSGM
mmetsp:Transcript_42240/g.133077  ORF Transcript_42240/g.133077 Transcript_42240/m.133077 type:complete len:201 (+) Transcript_42240:2034-2636(+)